MRRVQNTMVVMAALALLAPLVATAQDGPPPLTWVNMVQVNMTSSKAFRQSFERYDRPVLDKLLADGVIMSWGFGEQMAGPPGMDYAIWATMPNWAAITKVETAFMTARKGMSGDEMSDMIESWSSSIKEGSERTEILRHVVFKPNPDAPPPQYLLLSAYTAKPDMEEDATKMYKSFVAPVYDSLLASGAISGYGLIVPGLHTQHEYTHEGWVTFDDTAAMDAIDGAFMQDYAATGEGDQVARDAAFSSMFEPGTHHDRILRIIASDS